jgi:serine-type D-Ala-D-Ala carboxypeptidase/endopeptidase
MPNDLVWKLATNDERVPDGNSIFEIGSATKVFTALLLADMVRTGEAALLDPVVMYLPSTVKMPERHGRQITLQDLATHTSGLPRLPTNLKRIHTANPYADYSVEQLYQFLSTYELTRDIGSLYEYSNLGGGLLGHCLARRAGMDYEALVRTRICEPLGIDSTGVTLSPEMKSRCATGHNSAAEPVPLWDLPALAGAGALRSTANDLLTFLGASLGYVQSPFSRAMTAMLAVRRPTQFSVLKVALGWHVLKRGSHDLINHDGATGGFRSFVGFDRTTGTGVVALSNSGSGPAWPILDYTYFTEASRS